jgi:hypothetical protein
VDLVDSHGRSKGHCLQTCSPHEHMILRVDLLWLTAGGAGPTSQQSGAGLSQPVWARQPLGAVSRRTLPGDTRTLDRLPFGLYPFTFLILEAPRSRHPSCLLMLLGVRRQLDA